MSAEGEEGATETSTVGWASDAEAELNNGGVAPDALIVSVDAAMAPFHEGHEYHEVKVAVCQPLQRVSPTPSASEAPRWQPLNNTPDYCLGLEPRPEFWLRVRAHALQHGLASPTCHLVACVGDGLDLAYGARYLGGLGRYLVEIVDIFHAREHLWAYARGYFDTEAAATVWARSLNDGLKTDGPGPILDAMAALEAHHPGAHPTTVQEHHQYFVHQASRMDYPRYRALGLPIGSGIIEGTCQTLVKERLDAGGMWWTRVGAQTIGTWRALVNDSFKIPNKDNSMSPKTVVEFPQRRQLNIPKNAS